MPVDPGVPDNHVVIAGRLCELAQTRFSPSGVPICEFLLEHRSMQREADRAREAQCRVRVTACGAALQRDVQRLKPDSQVRVSGFLARRSHRSADDQLVLHAQTIETID